MDAGKTTVTERMLALAGVVRRAGNVDDGNTVTDYLPAERERGITIQSAAISFDWKWHNSRTGDDFDANDNVQVNLIDTPGHVDFSVEVNRSVAVLDGAVLVVDAVAGVQAQTETVWRALSRPALNNHDQQTKGDNGLPCQDHAHEPLPCLAIINKMDKEGCHFGNAVSSLKMKLQGANPIPIQTPLFRAIGRGGSGSTLVGPDITASPESSSAVGDFVGVVDLIHMRAVVWPEVDIRFSDVEMCVPAVIPLVDPDTHEVVDSSCPVTQAAVSAREELVASLADVDEAIEEYFLNEEEPSNAEVRAALRRATLARKALPVMAGAALKGKGIEPLLDSIADLLPSPLDRMPPALTKLSKNMWDQKEGECSEEEMERKIRLGHPLHPSLLAFAFKVVHMKGRGGSGDGRVVFARVYSGQIKDRATLQVISPPSPGEAPKKPRTERVGGMLELAGGRFDNMEGGTCMSGGVCALVGLKDVVTGDTIVMNSDSGKKGKKKSGKSKGGPVCLAGVNSPKPVLTVRLEAESSEHQKRLSEALNLYAIEDPSLCIEETESATLLSGLGELHIEVTLDRLFKEYGIAVMTGAPAVAYRETITNHIDTGGLLEYDRTVGATRLQASVHLILEPIGCEISSTSACVVLNDPVVTVGTEAREFLLVEEDAKEEDLLFQNELYKALVYGCEGALRRGPLGQNPLSNVRCHVVNVDAEGGLSALQALPGALRAAAANAVSSVLTEHKTSCAVLEPTMSVEITLPPDKVGTVVSDLTSRRGAVGDVLMGDTEAGAQALHTKALVRGEVPLAEILGYANSLRSLTGGEGAFTAEYKGHSEKN